MADIDLISSDDAPFEPWVREAAGAARDALLEIRAVAEASDWPAREHLLEVVGRGLGR